MSERRTGSAVLLATTWRRVGGLEAAVMDIAWSLRSLGWHVTVIPVFDSAEPDKTPGIEVIPLCPRGSLGRLVWHRGLWQLGVAWRVRRALAGGGLLVCAHPHLLPALDGVPRRPDVCRWAWVYGIDAWGEQARRWAPSLNRVDRVVSISDFTAREVVGAGLRSPISVVPCCVDTDRFTPTSRPDGIRREEILICGRMAASERHKGHEVLFRALPVAERLVGRRLSIRVIGTGDDQLRLEEVASGLGIRDRTHFAGWASEDELIDAYRHCGVFCMPSRLDRRETGYWMGEGFGIVYVEAASCGRPVIASSEGGSPETIEPGVTGLLVDPLSPDAVAQAIADVFSDPGRADELGRQGRALAESRFSRTSFVNNVGGLLRLDMAGGVRGRADAAAIPAQARQRRNSEAQ